MIMKVSVCVLCTYKHMYVKLHLLICYTNLILNDNISGAVKAYSKLTKPVSSSQTLCIRLMCVCTCVRTYVHILLVNIEVVVRIVIALVTVIVFSVCLLRLFVNINDEHIHVTLTQ